MPDNLGIAITSGDLWNDRIARVFREASTIGAPCKALYRGISCCGVEQNQRRLAIFAKAAGVLPIDHSTAAEHRPLLVRQKLVTEFLPMHHVFAHSVTPMHVPPTPSIWIVLKEQMVLTVVIDHTIGIIVPASHRRKMELTSLSLRVKILRVLDRVAGFNRR